MDSSDVRATINDYSRRFKCGSRAWAVTHHLTLFGAAALSATTAVLIKVTTLGPGVEDLAAALSGFAALLTTLSGLGKFRQKWLADRQAWLQLRALEIEMGDPKVDDEYLRASLLKIVNTQDDAWEEST